jgi:hypothetical protein
MHRSRPERPGVHGGVPDQPMRLVVLVHRCGQPPLPWTWAIHEVGEAEALQRSMQRYRSAGDAWTAGRAVLGAIRDHL